MEAGLTILVGLLFFTSFYALLRRGVGNIALGVILLGHATNLLIFVANGLWRDATPIVPKDATVPDAGFADPLPQAMILTALVINFALFAYVLILSWRTASQLGTDDQDALTSTEKPS